MTGTRLETRRRADPLHLAMADRELDTAYHHLTERRTPEFDREALTPDEPRPNAWVGAAFCTVFGLLILGCAVFVAVRAGLKAWGGV